MEHRWGKRVPADVAVTLRLPSGAPIAGRMLNVSLSGALVRTGAKLPPASRLTVDLHTGGFQIGRRSFLAHVVREVPGCVALEWSEFSPPAIHTLMAELTDLVSTSSPESRAKGGSPPPARAGA